MDKAVIASRTPAMQEVMTDGEDGLLVTPGSVAEIATAIARLARCPEDRRRMAATFQRRVQQQHTWTMVAGKVSQLLEHALHARQTNAATDLPPA